MDSKFRSLKTVDDLTILNGLAFEEYLRQLFTDLGYQVEKTSGSGDYGADIILEDDGKKIAVQAKQYASNVGFDAVKEVFFAKDFYKADEAWVICTGKFTQQARKAAKEVNVKLVGDDLLNQYMSECRQGVMIAGPAVRESKPADAPKRKQTKYQATIQKINKMRAAESGRIAGMKRREKAKALGPETLSLWNTVEEMSLSIASMEEKSESYSKDASIDPGPLYEECESCRRRIAKLEEQIEESAATQTRLQSEKGLFRRLQAKGAIKENDENLERLQIELRKTRFSLRKSEGRLNRVTDARRHIENLESLKVEYKAKRQELNAALKTGKVHNVYDDVLAAFKASYKEDREKALEAYSTATKIKQIAAGFRL